MAWTSKQQRGKNQFTISRLSRFRHFSTIGRISRRITFRVITYSWNQLLCPGQVLAVFWQKVHLGFGLSSTWNAKSFTYKITKISSKTMMLQTDSQSETLAHIHWHLFLYPHIGWAPCRLSSLSLISSGPDPMMKAFMSDSIACFVVDFQNQSQHTWCAIWQAQPFRLKSGPMSMAKGAANPLERSLVFFGMGCCWIWLTFQAEHFERADDIDLRLLNSKPPRKAKKVKQPALKRPAKASRKQPAVKDPQIPAPWT